MTQLKAAAAALREQLELARINAEAALQAERQHAQNEITQLQTSIVALRDAIDRERAKQ